MNIAGQRSNVGTDLRFWCGAPGRIRTRDPLLRRQLLCPAELRALERNCARGRSRDGYMKVAVCRPLMPCHLGKRHAASPPRTPQPTRLPHPAVSRGVPPGRPAELAGRPRPNQPAQSQGPPAVTSEYRPLRRRTPSRQAARGPVYPLKVTRGFMPLYLSGFLRDSTRHGRPGSSGAKTPTSTWIRLRRSESATTSTATSPGTVPNTSAPEYSTQSRHTALTAFRLAECPRRASRGGEIGLFLSGCSWAGNARPDPAQPHWCCCAPDELP